MKKIICFLFGHKWNIIPFPSWLKTDIKMKECLRCGGTTFTNSILILLLCCGVCNGQVIKIDSMKRGSSYLQLVSEVPESKYSVLIKKDTIYVRFEGQPAWKIAFRDTLYTSYDSGPYCCDTLTKQGSLRTMRFSKYIK